MVSFGIKHGATTGEEVTGVSMGVIVSTPNFSIFDNLFNSLFIAEKRRSSSLSWILSSILLRDGEVTTTNGLSTLSFLVTVLVDAVLFTNKLSDIEDTELLALMVEFEEMVDDLDGNEPTFALTSAYGFNFFLWTIGDDVVEDVGVEDLEEDVVDDFVDIFFEE